jgi:hypothetical protein
VKLSRRTNPSIRQTDEGMVLVVPFDMAGRKTFAEKRQSQYEYE